MKTVMRKITVLMTLCISSISAQGDLFPVVYETVFMGAVVKGDFVGPKEGYASIEGKPLLNPYRTYPLPDSQTEEIEIVKIVKEKNPLAPKCSEYLVTTKGGWKSAVSLPSSLPWKPQIREVVKEKTLSSRYVASVKALLKAHDIHDTKVVIREHYRVDIDGDGKEEHIVVAAESKRNPITDWKGLSRRNADFWDYACVVLLYGEEKNYKAVLLEGAFFNQHTTHITTTSLGKPSIQSIIDINGDGKMEIAVNTAYFESSLSSIYTVEKTGAKKVLYNLTECDQ